MPQYVQVPVPVDLVAEVMAFITARNAELSAAVPATEVDLPSTASTDWTGKELKKLWDESELPMRLVLTTLAQRADVPVSGDELAAILGKDRRGHTIAGMMGALGRRLKHRHEGKSPFERRWNALATRWDYCMHSAVAKLFETFVSIAPVQAVRPVAEVATTNEPRRHYCFIRSPLGARCRITTEKPTQDEAERAAELWLDEAMLEYSAQKPRAYAWVSDPAGYKDMLVCVETSVANSTPEPLLK